MPVEFASMKNCGTLSHGASSQAGKAEILFSSQYIAEFKFLR